MDVEKSRINRIGQKSPESQFDLSLGTLQGGGSEHDHNVSSKKTTTLKNSRSKFAPIRGTRLLIRQAYPKQLNASTRRPVLTFMAGALATITAFGGLAACGSSSDNDAIKEVKIGILTSFNDQNKSTDAKNGADLAAELINSSVKNLNLPLAQGSGLTRLGNAKIKIVTADSQKDTASTINAMTRLTNDDGVAGVIGNSDITSATQILQRAEWLKVPYVTAGPSADFLTEQGLEWSFRIGPTDRIYAQAIADAVRKKAKAASKDLSVALVYPNSDVGINRLQALTEASSDASPTDKANFAGFPVAYNRENSSIDSAGRTLINRRPDIIISTDDTADEDKLLANLKDGNFFPKMFLSYRAFDDEVTAARDGISAATSWSLDVADRNVKSKAIADLYQQRYSTPMTVEAANAFTSVLTLAQAIDSAKSVNREKIRAALIRINNSPDQTIMPWDGISFNNSQQNAKASVVIEQSSKGSVTTVYPQGYATGEIIWPASNARQA